MVTPDDHLTVAVAMIPSTMPAVVMPINLNTGAVIIAVAIVVPVAADAEAEPFSACDCRRRNRKGRQRGENVSFSNRQLPRAIRTNGAVEAFRNFAGTFLNGCST
jgi:hypothetical protein